MTSSHGSSHSERNFHDSLEHVSTRRASGSGALLQRDGIESTAVAGIRDARRALSSTRFGGLLLDSGRGVALFRDRRRIGDRSQSPVSVVPPTNRPSVRKEQIDERLGS
jgi:hypothetical protein